MESYYLYILILIILIIGAIFFLYHQLPCCVTPSTKSSAPPVVSTTPVAPPPVVVTAPPAPPGSNITACGQTMSISAVAVNEPWITAYNSTCFVPGTKVSFNIPDITSCVSNADVPAVIMGDVNNNAISIVFDFSPQLNITYMKGSTWWYGSGAQSSSVVQTIPNIWNYFLPAGPNQIDIYIISNTQLAIFVNSVPLPHLFATPPLNYTWFGLHAHCWAPNIFLTTSLTKPPVMPPP